jgi:hypothetical protein
MPNGFDGKKHIILYCPFKSMSLFTLRCMRRRKKRENFESLRSLSYSMQDISLQPPAVDSLKSIAAKSLHPPASHSLQSLAANSLLPPASHSLQSLAANSLQPSSTQSLQSLDVNSLHPPASHSLQSLAINSLQPPASHSLQSLAINSLQPPASHNLQSLSINSLHPPASHSLQSLSINSLHPPASHSLQSLSINSLHPPASHSLQSLAINGRQSPDGQSLQTSVVSSFLVGRGTMTGSPSPTFARTATSSVCRGSLSPTFARTGTTSVSRGGSLEPAGGTSTADISMPPDTLEVRSFSGAPGIRLPEDPVFATGTPGHCSVSYVPVFPTGPPVANPERASGTGASSAANRRNNSDVWSSTTDGKTNDELDDQQGSSKTSQTHQTSCSDGVLTIAIGQDDGGGSGSENCDEEATRTSKGGAGFVVHTDSFFGRDLSRLKIALSNHRDVIRPRNVKKRSRKL